MGDEGANLLLLRSAVRYGEEVLDAGLPVDEGDSPVNGGWLESPKGPVLLVEGSRAEVDALGEVVAARLGAAGVEGVLTGAGTTPGPAWFGALAWGDLSRLYGSVGLRPRSGAGYYDGWLPGPAVAAAAVGLGVGWLTGHGGELVVSAGPARANFRVDAAAAARIMTGDILRHGRAFCSSYQRPRLECRDAALSRLGTVDLGSSSAGAGWRDTVAELRARLLAAPLEEVSIAMVSHRNWINMLSGGPTESFHAFAYRYHPELWGRFTPDPCGMQILTPTHLAAAGDLSGWRTTRLDAGHVLVEARDLGPWFEGLRGFGAQPPAGLLEQARLDLGGMVLTPAVAEELGLTQKPPLPR